MSEITTIVPKSRVRKFPKGGNFDITKLNASIEEIIHEIQELQEIHNSTLVPFLSALPLGADDDEFPSIGDSIDPLSNGLSGDQLWMDNTATSSSDEIFYSNDRKLTIKESLLKVVDKVDSNFTSIQSQINDLSTGLSTYSRDYIGLKAFDSAETSSASSIDGRLLIAESNLDQVQLDTFGTPYSLNNNGSTNLNYPLAQIVDALLDQHGGAAYKTGYTYDTTISLSTDPITTDDITLGSNRLLQNLIRYSSSYTLLNRAAGVSNIQDDLNRIRYEIARLKSSSASWNNDAGIAPSYDPTVFSLGAHIAEQGAGTASSSNPHGLHLTDITGWNEVSGAKNSILGFTGMSNISDISTDFSAYGTLNFLSDGNSLEESLFDLDQALGSISQSIISSLQKEVNQTPNASTTIRGWAPKDSILTSFKVYMYSVNTQGNYTVTLTNGAGENLLDLSSYNMNTLVADTVTSVDLTAYTTRLDFTEGEKWTAVFTSDNASFDGTDIYFELIFTLV